MIREWFGFPRRTPDPDLIEAKRRTAESRRKAAADLHQSVAARAESAAVARELRQHNDANRYGLWLEHQVLRGGEPS